MLSRLVAIASLTWSTTDVNTFHVPKVGWTFDIYNRLLINPFIGSVLANFYYFRGDIEIHVRLNTSAMYAGALMVSAWPGAGNNPINGTAANIQARSWLHHWVLSAQVQDTLIFTLPWIVAERWLQVGDITVGHAVLWTVCLDILSPLLNGSAGGSSSVTIDVLARFVNPRVAWPVSVAHAPGSDRRKYRKKIGDSPNVPPTPSTERDVRLQSGTALPGKYISNRMQVAKGGTTKLMHSSGHGIPAESAKESSAPNPVGQVASTLTSTIDSVIAPVEGVLQSLQPILGIASALFDKPEIKATPTPVVEQPFRSFSVVDEKDPSLPATLYSTSYLTTDPVGIPEGGPWRLADVAMRPALHAEFTFTEADNTIFVPFMAAGTPFNALVTTHKFWRGSMRYWIKFFAGSMTSCRFLLVYNPSTITSDNAITDTLSRVIDVRGDTEVMFTLPYINEYDWITLGANFANLQISILTSIVSSNTTSAPSIDMVIWSAAGPDVQFAVPIVPQGFTYGFPNQSFPKQKQLSRSVRSEQSDEDFELVTKPPTQVRRNVAPKRVAPQMRDVVLQADVHEVFKQTMPPFLEGCMEYTDHHYVAGEQTEWMLDLMKRYQSYSVAAPSANTMLLNGYYSPYVDTLGHFISRFFYFRRGGIRYVISNPGSGDNVSSIALDDGTTTELYASGTAFVLGSDTAPLMVTCPWVDIVPFRQLDDISNPTSGVYQLTASNNLVNTVIYTAVRDDYQVGYLYPVDILA